MATELSHLKPFLSFDNLPRVMARYGITQAEYFKFCNENRLADDCRYNQGLTPEENLARGGYPFG